MDGHSIEVLGAEIWVWINTYENTIFLGMNIHFNPAILMWTEGVLLVLTHCRIIGTHLCPKLNKIVSLILSLCNRHKDTAIVVWHLVSSVFVLIARCISCWSSCRTQMIVISQKMCCQASRSLLSRLAKQTVLLTFMVTEIDPPYTYWEQVRIGARSTVYPNWLHGTWFFASFAVACWRAASQLRSFHHISIYNTGTQRT